MDHLLEITRIIDGAVKGDRPKVAAYVEQLSRKLRESGDVPAADRIQRVVEQIKVSDVATERATTCATFPNLPPQPSQDRRPQFNGEKLHQ